MLSQLSIDNEKLRTCLFVLFPCSFIIFFFKKLTQMALKNAKNCILALLNSFALIIRIPHKKEERYPVSYFIILASCTVVSCQQLAYF
jgi:cytochrome c oxidase subunit IV